MVRSFGWIAVGFFTVGALFTLFLSVLHAADPDREAFGLRGLLEADHPRQEPFIPGCTDFAGFPRCKHI